MLHKISLCLDWESQAKLKQSIQQLSVEIKAFLGMEEFSGVFTLIFNLWAEW